MFFNLYNLWHGHDVCPLCIIIYAFDGTRKTRRFSNFKRMSTYKYLLEYYY